MTEWMMKATNKKATHHNTIMIAQRDKFIPRSAYYPGNVNKPLRSAAMADRVAIGDIIHLYYVMNRVLVAAGSWSIQDPRSSAVFAPIAIGALVKIVNSNLEVAIHNAGYERDPHFGLVVGWNVANAGNNNPAINIAKSYLSGRRLLREYP